MDHLGAARESESRRPERVALIGRIRDHDVGGDQCEQVERRDAEPAAEEMHLVQDAHAGGSGRQQEQEAQHVAAVDDADPPAAHEPQQAQRGRRLAHEHPRQHQLPQRRRRDRQRLDAHAPAAQLVAERAVGRERGDRREALAVQGVDELERRALRAADRPVEVQKEQRRHGSLRRRR